MDAILEEMVRKVISTEVILDQRSDLKKENGPQGLVLKMIASKTNCVGKDLGPPVTSSCKYLRSSEEIWRL